MPWVLLTMALMFATYLFSRSDGALPPALVIPFLMIAMTMAIFALTLFSILCQWTILGGRIPFDWAIIDWTPVARLQSDREGESSRRAASSGFLASPNPITVGERKLRGSMGDSWDRCLSGARGWHWGRGIWDWRRGTVDTGWREWHPSRFDKTLNSSRGKAETRAPISITTLYRLYYKSILYRLYCRPRPRHSSKY